MGIAARLAAAGALTALAFGCSGGSGSQGTTAAGTAEQATTLAAPATSAAEPEICPLTLPNRRTPPDVPDWPPDTSYGNGELWTQFWPHNLVIVTADFVEEGGGIRMKWPWWRGVSGELEIEGGRLDEQAPPLTAEIPGGYGPSGFQPSGILFATEGCWEVTGTVGDASLTFVTLVVKASTYLLEPGKN